MTDQPTPKPVETVSAESSEGNAGQILIDLESTIKNTMAAIDKSKVELKKLREMLSDMFVNDPTYQEHDKAVKEASKVRAKTRSELLKQPAAAELNKKVKEMASELKEAQNGLSDYLREYLRMSGTNEIEGDDGEVREIIYVAKLVKKASKFR